MSLWNGRPNCPHHEIQLSLSMSTGSELLHKLRSQREINSKVNDCNSTSVVRYVTPLAASTFYKSNGASPLRQNEIHQPSSTTTTIEVCLGPDCSGSGGGAALLEIEELLSATFRKKCVGSKIVLPGGCRDYCTMGPNIYVRQTVHCWIKYYNYLNNR